MIARLARNQKHNRILPSHCSRIFQNLTTNLITLLELDPTF